MVPFAIFPENMDPGLHFGGSYSLVSPILEAEEFFENRVWGWKKEYVWVLASWVVLGRKIENRDFAWK